MARPVQAQRRWAPGSLAPLLLYATHEKAQIQVFIDTLNF
jgi:hypothetical protein